MYFHAWILVNVSFYRPHNGKDIGLFQLVGALRAVYNLSIPLAFFLSFVGILLCGHGFRLDLSELAAHNKIEHNGSLAHADAAPGAKMAPILVDPKRFRDFLSYATMNKGMFIEDITKARVDREQLLLKPLDSIHSQIGQGEVALAWLTMKNASGKITLDTLTQWWGEERLPEGYRRPEKVVGLFETRAKAQEVAASMNMMKF